LYGKADDLAVHRSGRQSMSRVEEEELTALVGGRTGMTWFLGSLAGTMAGKPFQAPPDTAPWRRTGRVVATMSEVT
jgi:hypothetical protein